ncbi:MAG: Rnase Y domain-containing protein, partial [Candidatus Entotheonellia bacterium]
MILMVLALGSGSAGLLCGYFGRKLAIDRKRETVAAEARRVLEAAEKEVENRRREATLEAKDHWYRAKAEFEQETEERRKDLQTVEQRIIQREGGVDRRVETLERRERELNRKERRLSEREEKFTEMETRCQQMVDEELSKLEHISGLTATEAKEELRQRLLSETRREAAEEARRVLEESREHARKKAAEIIALAIERYAADHVAESTVSVVDLPNDEMKGRI